MKYQVRKGIVLTKVGKQAILVTAASLHDRLPYVISINETTAFCWEQLIRGVTETELIECVLAEFDTDDVDRVHSDITGLVHQLYDMGFIVEVT